MYKMNGILSIFFFNIAFIHNNMKYVFVLLSRKWSFINICVIFFIKIKLLLLFWMSYVCYICILKSRNGTFWVYNNYIDTNMVVILYTIIMIQTNLVLNYFICKKNLFCILCKKKKNKYMFFPLIVNNYIMSACFKFKQYMN